VQSVENVDLLGGVGTLLTGYVAGVPKILALSF
jgi:hypothetical protein